MDSEADNNSDSVLAPEQWVDKYADILYRYACLCTGKRSVAEDLVQDTFLAALQARRNFQGRCSERTWLVSILRNKIAAHFRENQRRPVPASQMDASQQDFFEHGKWKQTPAQWSSDPESQASNKEFGGIFLQCLRLLSPTLAEAFILREIEKNESEAICSELEISETGLWSRLHRARLNLRHCLEKHWFCKTDKQ